MTASAVPVDEVEGVESVGTVRADTGDVMPEMARRAVRQESLRLNSVVGLAEAVELLLRLLRSSLNGRGKSFAKISTWLLGLRDEETVGFRVSCSLLGR